MIKPDRPPYCDYWQIGVFWKYFIFAGVIFVYERILREIRARHRTYISKVIREFACLVYTCAHPFHNAMSAEMS